MITGHFQIRHCLDPECGLRFPWYADQNLEGRCPICMGVTEIVREISSAVESPNSTTSPLVPGFSVLLDNIRSAWNVGSILRSAEGFGFSHAYICGITPGPENSKVLKTALGAQSSISWSVHKDATILIKQLRQEDHYILVLETHRAAIPLPEFDLKVTAGKKIVLIVGNEVTGVDPGLIAAANQVTFLPMLGRKTSINVAVAFGAAAYSLAMQASALFSDIPINDMGRKKCP